MNDPMIFRVELDIFNFWQFGGVVISEALIILYIIFRGILWIGKKIFHK